MNLTLSSLCAHRATPRPRPGLRCGEVAGSPGSKKAVGAPDTAASAPQSGEEVSRSAHVCALPRKSPQPWLQPLIRPWPQPLSAPPLSSPLLAHTSHSTQRDLPKPPSSCVKSEPLILAFQPLVAVDPFSALSLPRPPDQVELTQSSSVCLANSSHSVQLLTVVASLAAKHRLWSMGSGVAAPGLGCSTACGIIPDQG